MRRLAGVLVQEVPASAADGRQDFAGDPVLELPGIRFVGAHDHLVETALADDPNALAFVVQMNRVHLTLLIVAELPVLVGVAHRLPAEDGQDVAAAEPRLPFDIDGAELVIFVLECERGGAEVVLRPPLILGRSLRLSS